LLVQFDTFIKSVPSDLVFLLLPPSQSYIIERQQKCPLWMLQPGCFFLQHLNVRKKTITKM